MTFVGIHAPTLSISARKPGSTQSGDSKAEAIVLTDGDTGRIINTKHVSYIEGLGRYRRIHLSAEGSGSQELKTVLSNTTLDEFTGQLGERGLICVHQSYLINLSLVTSLQSQGRQYHVFLKGVTEAIPVARSRVKEFRANLGPAH